MLDRASLSPLQHALLLARAGIPVFPCTANKAPAIPGEGGYKHATCIEEEVVDLWQRYPGQLVGVPTGAISGISAVDIDPRNGGNAWEDENSVWLNTTRVHETRSGGRHYLFQYQQGTRGNNSRLGPGVDVRADGGYIIWWPASNLAIPNDIELQPWPAELTAEPAQQRQITASAPATRKPSGTDINTPYGLEGLARECDAIRFAMDGQKHDTLNKAAYSVGGLVAGGELEQSLAWADLQSALNDLRPACRNFRLAEKTLDRAFREGMGRPREVEHFITATPDDDDFDWAPICQFGEANLPAELPRRQEPVPCSRPFTGLQDVDGFLKEFVDYTVRTARRPQPFAALAAGISLVSALAGRKYRTKTDLWTNLYAVSIIDSAGGKDHARRIIKRILSQAGLMQYLGGEDIASGTALHTALKIHPSKLFLIDECGDFLKGVLGTKASAHKQQISQKLKSLYTSSADVMLGTEYADQSDKTGRKREDIHNPIATIYGTSTPAQFWSAVAGASLADGLLGRFLVFIPEENYPDLQDVDIEDIPHSLIEQAQSIAHGCLDHDPGNIENLMLSDIAANPCTVRYTALAIAELRKASEEQEALLKQNEGTYITSLAGRIVENASKLALIRCVSRSPQSPQITDTDMRWGFELSMHCFEAMREGAERHVAENETQARVKSVREIIRGFGGQCTRQQLTRALNGKMRAIEITEAANLLTESGELTATVGGKGKRGPSIMVYVLQQHDKTR